MMVVTLFLLASCASEEYKKGSTIIKETTKKVNEATDYESLEDAMDLYYKWKNSDPVSKTSTKEDIELDKQIQELKKLYREKEEKFLIESGDLIIEDEVDEILEED